MDKKSTDVMIYIHKPLSHEQFSKISSQMKTIDGVIRFDQSARSPKLIMVAYMAGKVGALTILNKVTRLGFNASLVGI